MFDRCSLFNAAFDFSVYSLQTLSKLNKISKELILLLTLSILSANFAKQFNDCRSFERAVFHDSLIELLELQNHADFYLTPLPFAASLWKSKTENLLLHLARLIKLNTTVGSLMWCWFRNHFTVLPH